MPERLECEVLQKARCINTLAYLPTYYCAKNYPRLPAHSHCLYFFVAVYYYSLWRTARHVYLLYFILRLCEITNLKHDKHSEKASIDCAYVS